MSDVLFGWTVERPSPNRVRFSKGDVEFVMKGSADMDGDALVMAALNRVMAQPNPVLSDAHVIEVPVAEMVAEGQKVS